MKMIVSFLLLLLVLFVGMIILQTANYQSQYRDVTLSLHVRAGTISEETISLLSRINDTLHGVDLDLPLPSGFISFTGTETRNGLTLDYRGGTFLRENSSMVSITYEKTTPFGSGLMFTRGTSNGYHYVFIPDQYWYRYQTEGMDVSIMGKGRFLMGGLSTGLTIERPIPNYPISVIVSVTDWEIFHSFMVKQSPVLGMMSFALFLYGVMLYSFIKQYLALKVAIQEAEVANIAKTQIIANTSHELRTPLNSVIGFSDLLLTGQLSDRHRRYITAINQSGKELLSLIDDILGFAKMEEGKFVLEEKEFALSAPLYSIATTFSKLAITHGIAFTDDISSPTKMIGDEKRILQVIQYMGKFIIQNSQRNASMTVRSEPEFILRFRTDEIWDADKMKNSHLPFAHGGNILTLPLVSRLVALHGGTMTVSRITDYPHGMEFTITFPSWRTEDV